MTFTRALTRGLEALAAILAVMTCAAAAHDVSTAWDVWYYHLPFAARLWGIVPSESYTFHATNQSRFDGFPLLAEFLQGLFWRVTGHPEAANFVAFGSLALFVFFLRRFFRVPLHLSVIALLAIPLVQLHATAAYIDLPANLAASALILLVIRLYARKGPAAESTPWMLLGLAFAVVNMRFQLHPVALLALLAAAPRVLVPLIRERARTRLALVVALLPLVFASPLKNAILRGNPYYPMKLAVLGFTLPGTETSYASSPLYLEHAPRAVRFVFSILEIGIRPFTDGGRWTIDQWAPSDSPALRMGGFFGAYVVFHVALLVWLAARDRSREVRVAALAFALITVGTALLPQSHELRYYLYWMVVLVSLNLALVSRDKETSGRWQLFVVTACTAALGIVLGITRCGYVYPSGLSFQEILRSRVDPALLRRVVEQHQACVAREPWTLLYAETFHRPARYALTEAESEADCDDAHLLLSEPSKVPSPPVAPTQTVTRNPTEQPPMTFAEERYVGTHAGHTIELVRRDGGDSLTLRLLIDGQALSSASRGTPGELTLSASFQDNGQEHRVVVKSVARGATLSETTELDGKPFPLARKL